MKKGGRLIVAGIFISGFFYVVRAKTYLSACFSSTEVEKREKMSDRASVYKGHLFFHFFLFLAFVCYIAAESYELSIQCAGGHVVNN